MKNIGSHFEEMTGVKRVVSEPFCLVSCLPQRMVHGNVKTCDVFKKKDGGGKQSG